MLRCLAKAQFAGPSVDSAGSQDSSATRIDPAAGRGGSYEAFSKTDPLGQDPASAAGLACRGLTRRRVGGYRLIEPLGAGTQGVVWRAVREDDGGEEVALKLLNSPGSSDRKSLLRLRREAARGALLDHPAILTVSEFGEADGVGYLVMELVDGWNLGEVLAMRRRSRDRRATGESPILVSLPEPEYHRAIAGILLRIAHGLHAAHSARIAHRDVKPSNILLDRRKEERAVLADFGLGRDLDVATLDHLRDWSGSPLYMAPEKLRGVHEDEIRCDIYAMGVTLFEALTLVRPFGDPGALPARAIYWHLARQRPLRPRQACPKLPEALEAIILGAMARDPGRRTPTAKRVADALANYLDRTAARSSRHLGHSPRFHPGACLAAAESNPEATATRPHTGN